MKWPPPAPGSFFPAFNLAVWRLPPPVLSPLPPPRSHCEIAVVSYGFLFLRDGRWVHVGVEATKHAVRVRQAHGSHGRHFSTSVAADPAAERDTEGEKRGLKGANRPA